MKTYMNWGGMLGFVLIITSVLFYVVGMSEHKAVQWIHYAMLAGGAYLGGKAKRDEQEGFLSYGEGLGAGTAVVFFGSIIVAFYTFIFFHFIDPEMMTQLLNRAEMEMYDKGSSEAEIEMAMKYVKMFMNPTAMAFMVVFMYTLLGFVFSLITAAILKKDNPSFDSNFK